MPDHASEPANAETRRGDAISGHGTAGTLLTHALRRARGSIFWERLWPAIAAIATAAGLFLALSWLGLWLWLPPVGRAVALFAFVVVAAVATIPLLTLRIPSSLDGLRRLDRASGLPHRPATAIADEIATAPGDPVAMALWRAHVERSLAAARTLKAGWPAPRLATRDLYALRAGVLILFVATFFAAGGERSRRVAAAFDWQGVVAVPNFRLDAWVSPPNYTGKAPVILPGVRPGEPAATASASVAVPVGSVLVVRGTGNAQFDIAANGGIVATNADASPQVPAGSVERRFSIANSGDVTVRGIGDHEITWRFAAIADKAPSIELAREPQAQARGALQLVYKLEDDYGILDAQARFALKETRNSDGATPRPLFGAPEFPLSLPQARARSGVGQTIKDLSDHPWAGADVVMTLVARDEANNEGTSKPHELRLPSRAFVQPMARALVEQRRVLALDAQARDRVLLALDALAIAPDVFATPSSVYLGLRSIYWNLVRARSDDAMRDVVQRMWSMATQIEDGNVSDTEAALRAAQERLREALERGASDEEIKRLTDDLRAALDKFLQALAEQMRRNPQQLSRRMDPNTRMLRSQDLKSMIDRLEQLARSGAKDAARQLLQELQRMLENLQTAQPGGAMDGDDDMMSALDELGDMIRKQQQLRDRTFREGQEQRQQRGPQGRQGQQGQQGQQGDQFSELQRNQQGLRDQLKKLMEELRKHGFGQQPGQGQQGQQGQQGDGNQLGRAGEAMGDAEQALGGGNADGAVDAQGRALEALRRGAQNLAQSMQQQGIGPGPGQPGRLGPARAQQETDPLGRPLRGRDYGDDVTVKVPGEIDVQRARRILEELRRRLGETFRQQLELDYIERLLKDF
ncbi:MAG: TIGR02302 family protein [Proteobacteria bacterium]|nr:TIGR02302 family protein [Pseudomonadota bacterium]